MDKLNPGLSESAESLMGDRIGGDIKAVFDPVIDVLKSAAGGVGWFADNWKLVVIGFIAVFVLLRD